MKIILKDIEPGDWILGVRAAKRLLAMFQKDMVVSYENEKRFYVKRNKASITVRPTQPVVRPENLVKNFPGLCP